MVQKDTHVDMEIPCDEQTIIDIERRAKEEGISVNEWITRAIIEKMERETGKSYRDIHAGDLTDDTCHEYKAKK